MKKTINKYIIILPIYLYIFFNSCELKKKNFKESTANLLLKNLKEDNLLYNISDKILEDEKEFDQNFSPENQFEKYCIDTIKTNKNKVTEKEFLHSPIPEITKKLGFPVKSEYLNLKKIKTAIYKTRLQLCQENKKSSNDQVKRASAKLSYLGSKIDCSKNQSISKLFNKYHVLFDSRYLIDIKSETKYYSQFFLWLDKQIDKKNIEKFSFFITNLKSAVYRKIIITQNYIIEYIFKYLIIENPDACKFHKNYEIFLKINSSLIENSKFKLKKLKKNIKLRDNGYNEINKNLKKINEKIFSETKCNKTKNYKNIFFKLKFCPFIEKFIFNEKIVNNNTKSIKDIIYYIDEIQKMLILIKNGNKSQQQKINLGKHFICTIKNNLNIFLKNQQKIIEQYQKIKLQLDKIIYFQNCKGICQGLSFLKGYTDQLTYMYGGNYPTIYILLYIPIARLNLMYNTKHNKNYQNLSPFKDNKLEIFINNIIKYQSTFNQSNSSKFSQKDIIILYNNQHKNLIITKFNPIYITKYCEIENDIIKGISQFDMNSFLKEGINYLIIRLQIEQDSFSQNVQKELSKVIDKYRHIKLQDTIKPNNDTISFVQKYPKNNERFYKSNIDLLLKPIIEYEENHKKFKEFFNSIKFLNQIKKKSISLYESKIKSFQTIKKLLSIVSNSKDEKSILLRGRYKKLYNHIFEALELFPKNQAIEALKLINQIIGKSNYLLDIEFFKNNYITAQNINSLYRYLVKSKKFKIKSQNIVSLSNVDSNFFITRNDKIIESLKNTLNKLMLFNIMCKFGHKISGHVIAIQKISEDRFTFFDPNMPQNLYTKNINFKTLKINIKISTQLTAKAINIEQKNYDTIYSLKIYDFLKNNI